VPVQPGGNPKSRPGEILRIAWMAQPAAKIVPFTYLNGGDSPGRRPGACLARRSLELARARSRRAAGVTSPGRDSSINQRGAGGVGKEGVRVRSTREGEPAPGDSGAGSPSHRTCGAKRRQRQRPVNEPRPHVFSKVTKTPITLVVIIHRERLRAQRGRAIPRVDCVLPSPLAASRTLSVGRSYDGDARPLDSCPKADGEPSVRAKKGRQGSHGKRL